MFFLLWIVIFFQASQQFVSVVDASDGVWRGWGRWSVCNTHEYARQTRFRKCLNSNGKVLAPSRCLGFSKRTRQCESCVSPLLKQHVKPSLPSGANIRGFNMSSEGFHATKTAWCAPSQPAKDGEKYVEISFTNFVQLTAIGTWGNGNGYIKKYKIKHSYDGKTWLPYINKAGEDEYPANMDTTHLRENKLESRLVTRYIRVYPTTSTAHACFKLELYGCEYNCGGLITHDATLLRPPSASIEEQNCLWKINSEFATKLQLKFPYFMLFCENGILELFDGGLPYIPGNDESLVEAFCGRSGKVSPQFFEGKSLWVHYRSNGTTSDTGFKMQVNSYVIKTLNATLGNILVQKDSFSRIYRYNWMIRAPRDNDTIELTLHYFVSNNTRSFAGKCYADAIIIHHGNQGETLVKRYCDTIKYPKVLNSTNGFLRIKYKSKTVNPNWKIRFSYKILGYPTVTTFTTPQTTDDVTFTVSKQPERGTIQMPSNDDTDLEASHREELVESSSKVPIIVSCTLAVLIAIVCGVALVHYLKRRHHYLRKHPYDCSNRPMSHFGDEDATPFINTNLLMWNDSTKSSNCQHSEKPRIFEKSKKSLPVVEVTLRENEPQRLSIISPEMLKSSSGISIGLPGNEENNTGSLKVSDNFTEECMKLLNNNLSLAMEGNNEEYNPEEDTEIPQEKFNDEERYGSLPEADRRSPEVDILPEVEDSLPEAEGHSPEKLLITSDFK